MAGPITPNTGLTPQGLDVASLQNAVSNITGTVNPTDIMTQAQQGVAQQPQWNAQQAQNMVQGAQIPQMTGALGNLGGQLDANTFMSMFMADQGLAKQYSPGAFTPASGTATNNPLVTAGAPQLTLQNVNQPFSTPDPGDIANLSGLQTSGITGVANNLLGLINSNLADVKSNYSTATQAHTAQLQALMGLASFLENTRQFNVSTGLNTNPLSSPSAIVNNSDMTFSDKVRKLRSAIDNAPNSTIMEKYQGILKNYLDEANISDKDKPAFDQSTQMLNDIQSVDEALNDPATSKRLASVMNDPVKSKIAQAMIASGTSQLLGTLGLNDSDIAVLVSMNNLSTARDRTLLGGRVTGYLLQQMGVGNLGFGKNIGQNQAILNRLKEKVVSLMDQYASEKGLSIGDIPGMESYMPYINQASGNTDIRKNQTGSSGGAKDPLGIL